MEPVLVNYVCTENDAWPFNKLRKRKIFSLSPFFTSDKDFAVFSVTTQILENLNYFKYFEL